MIILGSLCGHNHHNYLYKRGSGERLDRRGAGNVAREAEIGMMQPVSAKECQKPEDVIPGSLEGTSPYVFFILIQ